MSLVKLMEQEGKKFFQSINDKMVEHIAASLQSAATHTLRNSDKADLGLLKFTLTKQGSGEAAAIIPSVELSDDFVDFVSDDDIVFDESFSKELKDAIHKSMSKDFKTSFKSLLEGHIYNSDKNKLEEAKSDAASTHDITEDTMSAMIAMLLGAVIKDLNENKSSDPYKVDVLSIINFAVVVTSSNKVKVTADPHKSLKQLVKNDNK